jgi:hypothetical protein
MMADDLDKRVERLEAGEREGQPEEFLTINVQYVETIITGGGARLRRAIPATYAPDGPFDENKMRVRGPLEGRPIVALCATGE